VETTSREDVPPSVWLITTGVFAMVTSEFMAAGLLPDISRDIGVTVGAASMLISGFALGQVFGGWALGMPLTRYGARNVLTAILVLFALVQTIGVLSPWPVLLALRMVSGLALAAYFTVALSTVTRLVPGEAQPQATARVFAGVTIGTTLGLPLATFAGQSLTWQWAFHADTVVVLLAAIAIATALPPLPGVAPTPARELIGQLANLRLWGTFVTAGLSIGGALVAFGFFSAILQDETGVAEGAVPWLLTLYGLASVVGNYYVGRVTHTGPTRVVAIGVAVMLVGLVVFRLAPGSLPVATLALILVGGTGVSLNAAHTARTIAVGGATPAVMAMTPTIVTSGILLGTATGGVVADAYGVLAPLVVGASLAALALMSLLPELTSRRSRQLAAPPDGLPDVCTIAT
jgi:predicted MFS family arabinose efflux permease